MNRNYLIFFMVILIVLPGCFNMLFSDTESSGNGTIPFTSEHWQVTAGKFVEIYGRQSLMGSAVLKDKKFRNGTISFDLYVNGKRSYPGIRFRTRPGGNAENIYIRPHVAGHSRDALQYTPVCNHVACWQLYNGEGYTSAVNLPLKQWVSIRIRVSGTQAQVHVGGATEPTLSVDRLALGEEEGGIVLVAPPNGTAYFSDFRIEPETPVLPPPPPVSTPPGIIRDWEISRPFTYNELDMDAYYKKQDLGDLSWQKAAPEESGLVNLSRMVPRKSAGVDFVLAKTRIHSKTDRKMELGFGYSDWVVIHLNGEKVFTGSSPYMGRGSTFQGIAGFYDTVMLPLKKGDNELIFTVGETFGGWGFMARDNQAVYTDKTVKELWKTGRHFRTSESVLHDPERGVLYVSNFDQFNQRSPKSEQYISKVSTEGKVISLKWADGLDNPLGMVLHKGKLFSAERHAVAVIDPDTGKILQRIKIKDSLFLNDITADERGSLYVTDSRKNIIYRIIAGKTEVWLKGPEINDPNAVFYYKGKVLFGNSGDRSLKSADPESGEIRTVAKFEKGFIDGIRPDNHGNLLVSLWHGILYRVSPSGEVSEILDTTTPGYFIADFEYIKEKNLLLIPTFYGNSISAYTIE